MAPKPQQSKEAKAIAASNSSKGKKKSTYDKLLAEVPKYKMITPSILSDRLRINGSLARAAIRELREKGLIKPIAQHGQQQIYTRAVGHLPDGIPAAATEDSPFAYATYYTTHCSMIPNPT
eukprot:jgi/Chrzof1/4063/Cz13g18280.t1